MKIINKQRMKYLIGFAFKLVFFLIFITPLVWMVVSSFKPEHEIFLNLDSLKAFLIEAPTLSNYSGAFARANIMKYIMNSMIYVLLINAFGLVVNSICGYAIAKLNVPFGKQLMTIIILLVIIPFESIVLPLYLITNTFGLVNRFAALIIPFVANCFNIYLFKQFFAGIPDELLESARVDGSSNFRSFISIVVPISKSVYATVFILTFVQHWGDFLWPLIVASNDDIRTIQVGLQFLFTSPPISYGIILAGLTFSILPMLIIFLFFQKYYIESIATSGLKG